jgi:hypothetical protein
MGGGLMQLVAYGAQDVYLTGNPQITLFKVVYRRHTNFSVECIELSLDTAKPGGRPTVQVLRNGDLATRSYLRVVLPDLASTNGVKVAWVRRLGHALIRSVEMQIGGSPIDKHYGKWLNIWYELTHATSQERGYSAMIGDVEKLTTPAASIPGGSVLFIPLQFWFCCNYGLALPLIALQYHDVRFNFELETIDNLVCSQGTTAPTFGSIQYTSAGVLIDYVYLDSEERRRFAQVGHEYLIEQLQTPGEQNIVSQASATTTLTTNQSFTLNFNHPCKEFVWAHQLGAFAGQKMLCYSANDDWTAALQQAAVNLAKSCISSTSTYGWTEVTFANPETDPIVAQTINGNVWKFVAVNTGNPGTNRKIYIQETPIVQGGVNLGACLDDVTVEVDFTAGISVAPTISNVFVNAHSLTLEDVSIPLTSGYSSSFVDNRVSSATDFIVRMPCNYGTRLDGAGNIVQSGNIVLNGHDRFNVREGNYFNYVQPYQHHTRTPADGINVYSFALHPEQHQPTGTANMSRIDSTKLNYKTWDPLRYGSATLAPLNYTVDTTMLVYAKNYNVLRIMSGKFFTIPLTGRSGYANILIIVRMN